MAQWFEENVTFMMTENETSTDLLPFSTLMDGYPTVRRDYDGVVAHWKWFPMQWTWWNILQLLSAILGIFGNLLVMLVLYSRRKVRRSTDTLIGALAFADFLTSVFLVPHPQIDTLPSDGWLSQVYCRVIHSSLVLWIAVVASVFSLTAISVDRYLAIAYPFFFMKHVNSSRTSICILIIWVAAFATNSFQIVVGFAAENTCVVAFPSQKAQYTIGLFVFMIEFVVPITVMISTQTMTAIILHRQSFRFQEGSSVNDRSNANHIAARKRVVSMLLLVTTVFIFCWGPDQTFFLMVNLGLLDISFLYGPLHRSLVVLAFMNSCANVFIYTIRYPKFRRAICDMFRSDSKTLVPLFGEVTNPKDQKRLTASSSNV
ncbi:delta-type opioid receptor-like [Lytechinus variegatus]|uniref:delta-type opioid receptor-like n=1 Tax=Lytechinus variegatus TaxID=7654 RepID=UPI001BB25379|nr:delta-type opioid receptor-like [Lytechinus variegatus]